MKDLNYYLTATRLNLMAISRTARDGTIDVSAADTDIPALCKEELMYFSSAQMDELKANQKVNSLCLDNLKKLSKDEIKAIVVNNFQSSIEVVHKYAIALARSQQQLTEHSIKTLIIDVAILLGEGIVKPDRWMRSHDSDKFPYTKVENLDKEFDDFCGKFCELLLALLPHSFLEEKRDLTRKIAAWVEYRINLTDHFIADSCGKTAAVISAFVYILADSDVPIFISKDNYFHKDALPKDLRLLDVNFEDDPQFKKWHQHYIKNFFLIDEKLDDSHDSRPQEMKKSDYIRVAIDNMLSISKTLVSNTVGTTAYQTKREVVKKYDLATKPIFIANFSKTIENLYEKRNDRFPAIGSVRELIFETVYGINLGLIESSQEEFFLRKDDSDTYLYTPSDRLKAAMEIFIGEFFEKINLDDQSPQKMAAWIEYEICFHHHFFQDGNRRIAVALSSFYLMRYNSPLPQFKKASDWERAAPLAKMDMPGSFDNDIQLQRWFINYKQLFKHPLKYQLPSDGYRQYDSPWKISADEIVYLNGTIYEHSIQTHNDIRDDIRDLREASGLDVKELVVFTPQRIALHECIVQASVLLDLSDDNVRKNFFSVESDFYTNYVMPNMEYLTKNMLSLKINFEHYARHILESYLPGISNSDKDIKDRIDYYRGKIEKRISERKYEARVSEINSVLQRLIVNELLKTYYQKEIRQLVKSSLDKYILEKHTLPKNELKFLTLYSNFERITWAIVGGAASGKSSLKREVDRVIAFNQEESKISFCTVNPDIYKPFLVRDKEISYFAAVTHEESSYIADLVIARLWEMVNEKKAPHILLDVVKSSKSKMSLASYGGATINLYVATCPVEGNDGAVSRAFKRANDINAADYGRYVPTCEILNGHKQESLLLPETIRDSCISLHLFNTGARNVMLSAVIDDYNKNLKIYDPKGFFDFLRKSLLYSEAQTEDAVYKQKFNAEELVKLLMLYQRYGVTLSFRYSDKVLNPIMQNLKLTKEEIKAAIRAAQSDEDKTKCEELYSENRRLRSFYKKEDSCAVLSQEQGFICQNTFVFEKILSAFCISLEDFVNNLVDYKDENTQDGIKVTLYDSITHIKLFEYDNKAKKSNYNEVQLRRILPKFIPHIHARLIPPAISLKGYKGVLESNDKDKKETFRKLFMDAQSFIEKIDVNSLSNEEKNIYSDNLFRLGKCCFWYADYKKAKSYHEKARTIRRALLTDAHQDCETTFRIKREKSLKIKMAKSLHSLGLVFHKQANYAEAEKNLKEAIEIRQELYGCQNKVVAKSLNRLGAVYYREGNYKEAESFFEKALKIKREALEDKNKDVAISLTNLGLVFMRQGEYQVAKERIKAALKIEREIYGVLHLEVAANYLNLGDIYLNEGDYAKAKNYDKNMDIFYAKAQKHYDNAWRIYCNQQVANHPGKAMTLRGLGNIFCRRGEYPKAKKEIQNALEMDREIYGSSHPEVAGDYISLGDIYLNEGDYAKAQEHYGNAFDIYQKTYKKEHPNVAMTLRCLGKLFYSQGKCCEAIENIEKALTIYQALFEETHPEVVITLILHNLYKETFTQAPKGEETASPTSSPRSAFFPPAPGGEGTAPPAKRPRLA